MLSTLNEHVGRRSAYQSIHSSGNSNTMIRSLVLFATLFSIPLGSRGFFPSPSLSKRQRVVLFGGYQFGDISKGLAKKAASAINKVTGEQEYQFGDLTRYLDRKAKAVVNNITKNDEYEFGDLSRWADSQAKAAMTNFTGRETYELGDITKEVVRRVRAGDYSTEDMILLCKVLLTFGAGLTPVASMLPAKLLLEMMDVSLAQEVSGRLFVALASTLDKRFKETIAGDAKYKLGDKTRQAIQDLMATALRDEKDGPTTTAAVTRHDGGGKMDPALLAELDEWDRRLGVGEYDKGTPSTK